MPRITDLSEHDITEQRSRFYAAAVPAATLDEVKKELATRKKKYHKARHHCWACRVRDENGQVVEQARDDGEVGRPGMKLLELLRKHSSFLEFSAASSSVPVALAVPSAMPPSEP